MTKDIVKAVMGTKAILCRTCGHKIAEYSGLIHHVGHGTIYVVCKHKDSGKVCKTVNQIDL